MSKVIYKIKGKRASFKGKRASMEDYFKATISKVDGQMVTFFGVFNGHGGSRIAKYFKNNLFNKLSGHTGFIKDTRNAIAEAFRQTDVDYLTGENLRQRDTGSIASIDVMFSNHILVANTGDSRVAASRAG
ncbi:probable protein phosphatase 2C 11 [Tanacetum coccineum]